MIMQNIVLLAAIAAPVLILFLLRSNAAAVFLSLCGGALLVKFVGDDAGLMGSIFTNNGSAAQFFQLGLLLAPPFLTTVFTMRSMRGPKALINLIPAVAVGLTGVLLAVPLLPGGVQHNLTSLNGWKLLDGAKELVAIASVLASLVVFWIVRPSPKHDKKKHHH